MSTSSDPAPDGANAIVAADPAVALDAHGFDPADFQWVPVRRKRRHDGWSEERQRLFIETLADTGSVTEAARAARMSLQSCYRLRRSPDAVTFAAAWDAALDQASKMLADIAFDRAISGVDEPVLDKDGHCIYVRTRYNDRLLMFLMRAHAPRYRLAGSERRVPDPAPPVDVMLERLQPATPADPHLLMPPEDLDVALECADVLDGELPRWLRDPDIAGPDGV